MNKTVTVNIGGIVFHIDENAYERFKAYLESIRLHFTTAEGRDEIMQDIESRIAEMFQEKVKDSKQVITLEDVEEVTLLMGRPEQFNDSDSSAEEKQEPVIEGKIQKRLYRNPDEKIVGGVCSGIAAYFDIDPVWIRLIFAGAIVFFGSGFLLYIILWIIIPQADSSVEKLKMRGEPVNVSSIEKNIQEGREPKRDNFVSRFFDGLGTLFKYLFLFLGKLIAVFFLFIGLVIGIALFFSILALFRFPGTQIPEFLRHVFPDGFQFGLAFICSIVLVAVPFLMLAYAGARMLFNIRKSSRIVNFTALGIWLVALVTCIVMGISIGSEFADSSSVRHTIPVSQPVSRTMRLEMENKGDSHTGEKKYYDRWGNDDWNGNSFLRLENGQLQSGDIHLDVVKSPNDSFQLVQIMYAHGSSNKEASERATHISYSLSQFDSVMKFNNRFIIDKDEKYRGQKVQLLLKVPVGGSVYLDHSLDDFIYDIDNIQNIYDRDMLGKNWLMTERGLTCVDCDGTEDTIGGEDFDFDGNDSHVKIDQNGVHISSGEGDDESIIKVDSTGVEIKSNGKTKKIKNEGGVNIKIN
jgi:phage shock protein PspC (stress-responsive transcriptional regulator)